MKTALTIAGSDPTGGAGVQADLRTFSDFGIRGLSAITALTAQNGSTRKGVKGVMAVPPRFLIKQVEAFLGAFTIDAVKIGMLAKADSVDAVGRIIKKRGLKNVVLDPVFRSSSGYPLLQKDGLGAIKRLLPLVTVVTPNIDEAAALSGIKVIDTKGMEEAAVIISSFGPRYVLIKGGHLKGSPVDVLFDGRRFYQYKGRRIKRKDLHGTGCILSSAIAAGLARGRTVKRATEDAKAYLMKVLRERPKAAGKQG
jgi:hydroxymethylpyrimidine kinase/phosphomethylpyrimidine kinase